MDKTPNRVEYELYSNEQLSEIINDEGSVFSIDEKRLAEEVLVFRGVDVASSKANVSEGESAVFALELPGGQRVFTNEQGHDANSGLTDRIDSLVKSIELGEKEITERLKKRYNEASDEDLLNYYEEIVNKITNQKSFGSELEEDSLKNFHLLLNIFESRRLVVPEDLRENHKGVLKMLYRSLSKEYIQNGYLNLAIGLISLLSVLFFLLMGYLRVFMILVGIFGIKKTHSGVTSLSKGTDYKNRYRAY